MWQEGKKNPTQTPDKEYYLNQGTDCTLNIVGRENEGIPGTDDQVWPKYPPYHPRAPNLSRSQGEQPSHFKRPQTPKSEVSCHFASTAISDTNQPTAVAAQLYLGRVLQHEQHEPWLTVPLLQNSTLLQRLPQIWRTKGSWAFSHREWQFMANRCCSSELQLRCR